MSTDSLFYGLLLKAWLLTRQKNYQTSILERLIPKFRLWIRYNLQEPRTSGCSPLHGAVKLFLELSGLASFSVVHCVQFNFSCLLPWCVKFQHWFFMCSRDYLFTRHSSIISWGKMIYTINLVIIFQIRISLFNIVLVICPCVMLKTAFKF